MRQCTWDLGVILFTGFIFMAIVLQKNGLNGDLLSPACAIKKIDGLLTASCGYNESYNSNNTYQIPDDLPNDIQVLIVAPEDQEKLIWYNFTAEQLQKYPKILRLVIQRNALLHQFGCEEHFYADVFKDLDSLEYFEFSNSRLTDRCVIQLPKNLKKVVLNYNRYTYLDVHWCSKLEELIVQHSDLESIPKFHDPLPPLKKLNMLGSSLDNMSILDIAALCNLTSLEVDKVPGIAYEKQAIQDKNKYCQCLTFINWAKEFHISGLQLNCPKPSDLVENFDCSDTNKIIKAARKLREERCPIQQTKAEAVPKSSISNVIRTAFFVLLALLLIASIIYLISRLRLRERWAAHREDMAYEEEEEEEEEEELDEPSLIPARTDSKYAG